MTTGSGSSDQKSQNTNMAEENTVNLNQAKLHAKMGQNIESGFPRITHNCLSLAERLQILHLHYSHQLSSKEVARKMQLLD